MRGVVRWVRPPSNQNDFEERFPHSVSLALVGCVRRVVKVRERQQTDSENRSRTSVLVALTKVSHLGDELAPKV